MEALKSWLAPLLILVSVSAAGLAVRLVIGRKLRSLLDKATDGRLHDLLLAALRKHVPLWFFLAGLSAAAQASPLAVDHQLLVHRLTVACFFISITFALSGFSAGAVRFYSEKFAASSATASLSETLAKACVYLLGVLLLLANLGISITPVLTALGVGSLAVALALQDTLNNLFSGISIVSSKMVEVGEYVKLDSGFAGTVLDIGWRTSRLKDGDGHDVVIPNSKLAQSVVVNFGPGEPPADVSLAFGVPYDADLAAVETAAQEAAAETQKSAPGAARGFSPAVVFTGLSDSAVTVSVSLRAATAGDKAAVTHDYLKRLRARFVRAGVDAPYPRRLIRLVPNGKPL